MADTKHLYYTVIIMNLVHCSLNFNNYQKIKVQTNYLNLLQVRFGCSKCYKERTSLFVGMGKNILVLDETWDKKLSVNIFSSDTGRLIIDLICFAPVFLHIKFQVLSIAPYSWLVDNISSSLLTNWS